MTVVGSWSLQLRAAKEALAAYESRANTGGMLDAAGVAAGESELTAVITNAVALLSHGDRDRACRFFNRVCDQLKFGLS